MKHLPQAKTDSLFRNSLSIFLIRFFPSLANVLVSVFFSRTLDTDVNGMYQQFWIHLFVLSAIAGMGIQTFTLTYTPATIRALVRKLPAGFFVGFFALLFGTGIVFAWLQHTTFSIGWFLPFVFLLIYSASVIAESLLMVFRRFRLLVWVNMLHTALFCLAHSLLLSGLISWQLLFLSVTILAAMRLCIYLVSAAADLKNGDTASELPPLPHLRALWLHLGVYDISQILFRWIDKFIISFVVGTGLVAIYQNGAYDIPFLPLLLGAVAGAGLMRLAEQDHKDKEPAIWLANRTGCLLSCIVFPLFFFFAVFRYELFSFVFTDKYLPSVPVFFMSALAIPLRAYSFTSILQNRHKGNIINAGAVFDLLLACALMFPLYKFMGLPGVALSFSLSSYIQAGYYLHQTSRLLKVPVKTLIPLKNWAMKLIVFAILFIGVHYLASMFFEQAISLLLGCILFLITASVTFLLEYKAVSSHGQPTR